MVKKAILQSFDPTLPEQIGLPPRDPEDPDEEEEEQEEDNNDDGDPDSGEDSEVEIPPETPPPSPVEEPPAAHTAARYESRIRILDAYQYPGSLKDAPQWVDRNWIGYADHDPVRAIEAGPCLRVPIHGGATAICRIGDYACRQEVTLAKGVPPDVRIEVWDREQFEKLFVPAQYANVIEGTVQTDPLGEDDLAKIQPRSSRRRSSAPVAA